MSNENMKLWNDVSVTEKKYTREYTVHTVDGGEQSLTAINPQWQLLKATERWGPYGFRWGLDDIKVTVISDGSTSSLLLQARFFYPANEADPEAKHRADFPIVVDVPFRTGCESAKTAQTAARSKALSYLGFSADVFLGKRDEYEGFAVHAVDMIATTDDKKSLENLRSLLEDMVKLETIPQEHADELNRKIAKKLSYLEIA